MSNDLVVGLPLSVSRGSRTPNSEHRKPSSHFALPAFRFLPFLLVLFGGATPLFTAERINDYGSRIEIHADGSLLVTETITVTAERDQIKRGIYRDFPTVYPAGWGTRRVVPFQVLEVRRDGRPEPFRTEPHANGVRVYAGRADHILPSGRYVYTIRYRTARQLGFFDGYDELTFNVTGLGWAFPIEHAAADVTLPGVVPAGALKIKAFTGAAGEFGTDYSARVDPTGGPIHFETTRPLRAHEGMTIAVGFPKGLVAPPDAAQELAYWLADNRGVVAALAGLLVLLGYYVVAWAAVGRDPMAGVVVPRFEPPPGMAPACVRYVDRMGYDRKCFAAALMNLAVKGYLSIDQDDDGQYTLKRKRPIRGKAEPGEQLSPGERRLGARLLRHASLSLKNSNHTTISKAIGELQEFLKLEYNGKLFFTNRRWLVPGLLLSVGVVLAAGMSGSWEQVFGLIFIIVWLTFWTIAVLALSGAVVTAWRQALAGGKGSLQRGFGVAGAIFMTLFAVPFWGGELAGLYLLSQIASLWIMLLIALVGAINVLFFGLIKRPTVSGRRVLDEIEGFRMYLSAAEGRFLDRLQPPDRSLQLFERYLPYAVALDVENQWAEQFNEALAAAAQADPTGRGAYQPAWYHGSHWDASSPGTFASSIGSSLGGAIAASATAPGSSSSFSSSGGGSGGSGSGGGGGGGGGW